MGLLKKIAAAVAVKEIAEKVAEKVEERRHPKRSAMRKFKKPALLGLVGGAGTWLYKNGKLGPIADKVNEMRGNGSRGPQHNGASQMTPDAPAAVTGNTASGTSSTSQSV